MSFIKNVHLYEHNIQKKKYVIDNTELYVFKNFLSDKDYNTCVNIIDSLLIKKWEDTYSNNVSSTVYGHSSIGWHPYYIPHWNITLSHNDFFRVYIFSKIRSICEWTKNLEIKRIYCSFQTAEQFGNWHYDDDKKNTYTFCLYYYLNRDEINKDRKKTSLEQKCNELYSNIFNNLTCKQLNDDDDDGYFHIKYDNEPIRVIKAGNNSAVLFDSNIAHNGDSPKYDSSSLRCVIAYKLLLP